MNRLDEERWLRWVHQVERLLGHLLDGDQEQNGYSIDEARDLYFAKRPHGEPRISPEGYAKRVRDRRAGYKPDSLDIERFKKERGL